MVVIGLTGGIGSGKSTVADILVKGGAVVIDADQIARELAAPGGATYQPLVDHFGSRIVQADGTLDRAAMAARAFSDASELAALNAITHPMIAATVAGRVDKYSSSHQVVVLEIPLLGVGDKARYGLAGVIVVDAPVETAVQRLVEQRGLSEADARARVDAQIGPEERRRLADVVIDNGGPREALDAAVSRVWTWIDGLVRAREGR